MSVSRPQEPVVQRRWQGFSAPRTAGGRSSLVEPLPHHISVNALHVTFRADPERVRGFLPPGLDPVEDGRGWVMVGDLTKVPASDPELLWRDPMRTQYSECVVGFLARYGDRVGRYTALVWVDRDWSLGMGPIFGWGKRLATVVRTHLHAQNPAVADLGATRRQAGMVYRQGHPVVAMEVDTTDGEPLERLPNFGEASFLYRYIPGPGPDVPPVEQLLELPFTNVRTENIVRGTGAVRFFPSEQEELDELGEVEVTDGFTYDRGWTTSQTAVLLRDDAEGSA